MVVYSCCYCEKWFKTKKGLSLHFHSHVLPGDLPRRSSITTSDVTTSHVTTSQSNTTSRSQLVSTSQPVTTPHHQRRILTNSTITNSVQILESESPESETNFPPSDAETNIPPSESEANVHGIADPGSSTSIPEDTSPTVASPHVLSDLHQIDLNPFLGQQLDMQNTHLSPFLPGMHFTAPDIAMAKLHQLCQKAGAPKYLPDKILKLFQEQISVGFDPLQPGIPSRDSLLQKAQSVFPIPPPEAISVQLETGHSVMVYRNSFPHLLQQHLLSACVGP